MKKIILSVDTTADYMLSEIKERGLKHIPMAYVMNDQPVYEVFDSSDEFYAFFKKIEDGAILKTTRLNMFEMKEYFEHLLLETEDDIIHYPLSGGLSGTYQSALDASEEINKELEKRKTNRKIYVVETFGATQSICHLVDYAIKLRDEGKSAEEIIRLTEEFRDHQQIFMMVNDLAHLKRGGRVSGVSAAMGTLFNIKPILILNNEGKLVIYSKETGMKKAFSSLINAIKKYGQDIVKQTVIVAHSGKSMCDHGKELAQKIKNELRCETILKHIGTVIGTHLGPDALMVIFSGVNRLYK